MITSDPAENILAIFGFYRTLYDKPKYKRWWFELKRTGMGDIQAESEMKLIFVCDKGKKEIF